MMLAQAANKAATDWFKDNVNMLVLGFVLVIVGFIVLAIFFSFFRLWLQSYFTNAKIGIVDLVGMKLRQVDYTMIVRQKIALVQAGVAIATKDLEAHYLARGN